MAPEIQQRNEFTGWVVGPAVSLSAVTTDRPISSSVGSIIIVD